MKGGLLTILAGLLLVLVIVGGSAIFTVDQTQTALVLRFGEAKAVITEPGLHFKEPFFESVVYFDKRIQNLDSPQEEVLASDSQRLLIDAFLVYHIADPLKFYQTVGTVSRADNQLGSVLNSAVRRVLGDATQVQIITDERAKLMVTIRDQVNTEAGRLGAAVDDVRIRRADLPREISEKVFSRMQSERAREAAEARAEGSEQAQKTTAQADKNVVVLKAEAQRQADITRGAGDAERNRIFAEAYGKDPDFFAFYRSMQAYAAGLKTGDTRLVLSPTSSFFRYFDNPGAPNGAAAATDRVPPAPAPAAAPPAP